MKLKSLILTTGLLLLSVMGWGQALPQTSFSQSLYVNSTVSSVSEPGVAEQSIANTHTVFWTTTGTVVGTVTLQTSSTSSTGTWATMSGSAAQDLSVSGSYTFQGVSAAYVGMLVNVSTCTACTITITYVGSGAPTGTFTDGYYFIPASSCSGAITGTAGTGNATLVTSGAAQVYRLSSTAAGASTDTLTCNISIPSRLTTGKGITITDITILMSFQTTAPTSQTLPTLKSYTAPAATDPETASSATFTAFGGTITQSPTATQFIGYAAVTAGQFYSLKAILGTPTIANTDLQGLSYQLVIAQSASAAMVLETPGLYVHYKNNPL